MNRHEKYGVMALVLSLSAVAPAACQRLAPGLTGGQLSDMGGVVGGAVGSDMGGVVGGAVGSDMGGMGGVPDRGDPGTGGAVVVESDCPNVRMQAYDILQTNCAICHQAPGTPELYLGSFNFILDLAQLTSSTSPQSSTTLTLKYLVEGKADYSYLYQRIVNGSMPPITRTQRPLQRDIDVLHKWITSCINDPATPAGWYGSGSRGDAGVDAGPMLDSCGAANVCPGGGCCVFNRCRPNGTTCGALPNPIPGQANLPGLPGMCTSGSCQNAAGNSCGKVGEPCCDFQSCTASQSSCLTTDMTMCSACGGTGQPCCKPTNCLDGRACVGSGVGRVGTCQLCGAIGQPCCGTGGAALQRCDGALVCVTDAAMGTRCASGADGGSAAADGGPGGRGGTGGAR